jgi:PilZ domain-containing protein
MKYMQEGGFQRNPMMRLTLSFSLGLLVVFWISGWAMYFQRMDLHPRSVVDYYNGNEAEFRNPQSASSMTETLHIHMAMMSLVLLLLTHLAIFIPMERRTKVLLISATFLSAFAEEAGGWLVRFVSPSFAPVKIVGLLGLQGMMAILMGALGAFLLRADRRSSLRRKVEPAMADVRPAEATRRLPSTVPSTVPLTASVGGATLIDISATGMRLELAVPLAVDSVHSFHLSVGGQAEKVGARVASCSAPGDGHPRTYVIGLEFRHVSESMFEALSREVGPPGERRD